MGSNARVVVQSHLSGLSKEAPVVERLVPRYKLT